MVEKLKFKRTFLCQLYFKKYKKSFHIRWCHALIIYW